MDYGKFKILLLQLIVMDQNHTVEPNSFQQEHAICPLAIVIRKKLAEATEQLSFKQKEIQKQKSLNFVLTQKLNQLSYTVNTLQTKTTNQMDKIKRLEISLDNQKALNLNLKNQHNSLMELSKRVQKERQKQILELFLLIQDKLNLDKQIEKAQLPLQPQSTKERSRKLMKQITKLVDLKRQQQEKIKKLQQNLKVIKQKCKKYQNSSGQASGQVLSENNSSGLPSQMQERGSLQDNKGRLNEQQKKHPIKEAMKQDISLNDLTGFLKICSLQKKIQQSKLMIQQQEKRFQEQKQQIQQLKETNAQLETILVMRNKESQCLQQKLAKIEFATLIRQSEGMENEPSQIDQYSMVQRRRMQFQGQSLASNSLNLSKSIHKGPFQAIAKHYQKIEGKQKNAFLHMLAFWGEQKLKTLYQSMQRLKLNSD